MFNRREFLEALSALGVTSVLAGCSDGNDHGSVLGEDVLAGPAATAFSSSLSRGTQMEIGGDADGDEELGVVAGKLPWDLEGHVLIVASVPTRADTPLLTGEGVVYRISFSEQGARIKTRIIRTDDWYVAQQVQGTADDFGILFDIAQFSPTYGARNLANTALLPIMNGRLLATYDMGRPIELDPRTLHPITPVGLQDSWRPSLDSGLFTMHFVTAHPAYDAKEQRVYAINYGLTPLAQFLRIMRWSGASEPEFLDVVDAQGKPVALSMLGHQMSITEHYVVILDGAFDVVGTTPPTQAPLYIVAKSSLTAGKPAVAKRIVIDRECTHFLADYNDAGDRVRLLLMHHNGTNTGSRLKEDDVGFRSGELIGGQFFRSGSDRNVVGRHEIHVPSGTVTSVLLSNDSTWGVGLWGQDPRSWDKLGTAFYQSFGFNPDYLPARDAQKYADYPFGANFAREVPLSMLPADIITPKLVHIDHEGMQDLQTYAFEQYTLASSPTFVPRKGRATDDDGYILVTVAGHKRDELWIFDATDLQRGPLCKLSHANLDFPFTLHSTWMPSLESHVPSYKVERAEDYGKRIDNLARDKQQLARDALQI